MSRRLVADLLAALYLIVLACAIAVTVCQWR